MAKTEKRKIPWITRVLGLAMRTLLSGEGKKSASQRHREKRDRLAGAKNVYEECETPGDIQGQCLRRRVQTGRMPKRSQGTAKREKGRR